MRSLLPFLLLLGVLLATACGDDPPEHLRPATLSSSLTDSCVGTARTICARAETCSPKFIRYFFGSVSICEDRVTRECSAFYGGPGAADAIPSCTAAAEAVLCEDVFDVLPALALAGPARRLFDLCPKAPGRFAVGELCLRDGDCSSGVCSTLAGDIGCRQCRPPLPREGEACTEPGSCAPPLACIGGKCIRRNPIGGDCRSTADCVGDAPCIDLRCVDPSCRDGEPGCWLGRGETCVETTPGGPSTCKPFDLVPVGSACVNPFEVGLTDGPQCDADGVCIDGVCRRVGRLGEPCSVEELVMACEYGAMCRDSVCTPAVPPPTECIK